MGSENQTGHPEIEGGPGLAALARRALAEMIAANKLSGGDLIKLLSLLETPGQAPAAPRDYTIRLTEEEP